MNSKNAAQLNVLIKIQLFEVTFGQMRFHCGLVSTTWQKKKKIVSGFVALMH